MLVKDRVKYLGITLPGNGAHVIFRVPMPPKSWSGKKRAEMNGQPHLVRPDADNLCKALLDAVFGEDSHVWDIRITKVWSEKGGIEILNVSRA